MSDYKESGIRRRDERHTATPDIRPPGGSKKNTKKWCRGVVGREHQPECRDDNRIKDWKVLTCSACGKHLDYYYPSPWFRSKKPKPEWVK